MKWYVRKSDIEVTLLTRILPGDTDYDGEYFDGLYSDITKSTPKLAKIKRWD